MVKDSGDPSHQFDLVLKLSGQALIAGFIDISLALLAVGSWKDRLWLFFAEITVRVKIAFFAVSARFRFNYELAGDGDRTLLEATATPDAGRLSESEWLAYCAAFAQET